MAAWLRGRAGKIINAAILVAALAVFAVLLWPRVVRPFVQVLEARHWVAVPAMVETSDAESLNGSSDYFRPRVTYRYRFGGQEYAAERYQFFDYGVKSKHRMRDIVAAHPAGAAITIHVDPDDASQSVIQRGLTMDARGPLIFISVAGLMALGALSMLMGALGQQSAEANESAARAHPDGEMRDVERTIHDIDAELLDPDLPRGPLHVLIKVVAAALALALFATFGTFVYDAFRESVAQAAFLATFLSLPLWFVAIGWFRKRRDPGHAVHVRLRLLEELRFGSTSRVACEIQGRLPMAKAAFRVEAHTWPSSQVRSLMDRRRYCHRTAWTEFPPAGMTTLKFDLPPDPRPADCDTGQWIGWFLRVDLTLARGETTTRLQELARFPPAPPDAPGAPIAHRAKLAK